MQKYFISHIEVRQKAIDIGRHIRNITEDNRIIKIHGVPRGGIPVAYFMVGVLLSMDIQALVVENPAEADVFVDDIVDSGKTERFYTEKYNVPFFALIDKKYDADYWYVFPWELGRDSTDSSAEDIVIRQLEYIGEDVARDGLKDTPKRVLKAWDFMFAGYNQKPEEILGKSFDNDMEYDEMVVLRDIEFYSTCEHHLLPFFGKVHICYIPSKDGKVVGISKLARLVECFARRAQIQERLTKQIADTINDFLKPQGVAVIVEAQHLCMTARGVQKQNSVMVTSALHGTLKDQSARIEFLTLKGGH